MIEKAYEIRVSEDERRSRVFGYFKSKIDGLTASNGKGWYGGNGFASGQVDVVTVDVGGEKMSFCLKDRIVVHSNLGEYNQHSLDAERKAAIAKLTERERKLLGV